MEKRDLYDEYKNKTNETIDKGQPIPKGKYYITVIVFIQNSKNEFLIQKTSLQKGHVWSTTGGHPKAGESSLQGIVTWNKRRIRIRSKLKIFKTI